MDIVSYILLTSEDKVVAYVSMRYFNFWHYGIIHILRFMVLNYGVGHMGRSIYRLPYALKVPPQDLLSKHR